MKALTASDESHKLLLALLSDFERDLPVEAYRSIRSDIQTVVKRTESRGLTILMDDMPKLCRSLDKCLSSDDGYEFEVPHSLSIGSQDPQYRGKFPIYWSLIRMVLYIRKVASNRYTGYCNPSADPNLVLLLRSLLLMFKKVREDCSDAAKKAAMEEFVSIDKSLPKPVLSWASLVPPSEQSLALRRIRNEVNNHKTWRVLRYVLGQLINLDELFDPREIVSKHGPGAVSDLATGGDKYSFPCWPGKLGRVFPSNEHGTHGASCSEDSVPERWGDQWPCARLLAVPKTLSKPRIIASEPTAHMWVQQGLLKWIRKNLTLGRRSLDFHSQVPSQEMALGASRNGQYVTIDLSNASDYLSLATFERFFSSNASVLDAFWACRTTRVTVPELQLTLSLRKFAAMGSAVTFPVQSLIYLAIAVTAVLGYDSDETSVPSSLPSRDELESAVGEVRIFGDDIILPRRCYHRSIRLLSLCGMKVNESKTHIGGLFRESCGMDAFAGYNVSPLYIAHLGWKGELSQLPSRVAVSNNAFEKGLWRLSNQIAAPARATYGRFIPITRDPLGCLRLSDRKSVV